jgi:hypothetical protein
VAEALLEGGRVEEAWARACDAVHLDRANEEAVVLEARIRKILDEQAAPAIVREQTEARPDPGREEARREPAAQPCAEVRPEARITAPNARERPRTWIVAVIVTLAMLFLALAVRTC